MVDVIGGKAKEVGYENKLFDFNLIIQEKDRKTAGDGEKVSVKKRQEIKILWKKYESGLVAGQPTNDSEVIQFEKDGKRYDIEVKELILHKGFFSDRIAPHVKFAPDLRYIPIGVPLSDYPPYHVYNLNPVELKNGVSLVKTWKTGRIVVAGLVMGVVLIASFSSLAWWIVKRKKNQK